MTVSLDTFESSLLTGLREHVQANTATRNRRRRIVRGACLATGAAMAAGAALFVGPVLGPSAAYSVSEGNAGQITVNVRRLEDAAGLQSALAHEEIHSRVTYLPNGQECSYNANKADHQRGGIGTATSSDHSFEITLAPGTILPGETLLINASLRDIPAEPTPDSSGIHNTGGVEVWLSAQVVRGDPGDCLLTQ